MKLDFLNKEHAEKLKELEYNFLTKKEDFDKLNSKLITIHNEIEKHNDHIMKLKEEQETLQNTKDLTIDNIIAFKQKKIEIKDKLEFCNAYIEDLQITREDLIVNSSVEQDIK